MMKKALIPVVLAAVLAHTGLPAAAGVTVLDDKSSVIAVEATRVRISVAQPEVRFGCP